MTQSLSGWLNQANSQQTDRDITLENEGKLGDPELDAAVANGTGNAVRSNTTTHVEADEPSNGIPIDLTPNSTTLEVAPSLWQAGANAATATGASDLATALAAQRVKAPTIQNANQAASRAQLASTRSQYGALDKTLQGGGPNIGQAQLTQNQTQGIAAQLAASRGQRGYSGGAALGAGQAGQANSLAAAQAAAQARGAQVNTQQGALTGSLAAQGNMNMSQYGTEQNAAGANASLAENQQQINNAQTNAFENEALQQQGAQLNAINEAGQAGDTATGLSISQQQLNNQQIGTELGTGWKAAGTIAAFL